MPGDLDSLSRGRQCIPLPQGHKVGVTGDCAIECGLQADRLTANRRRCRKSTKRVSRRWQGVITRHDRCAHVAGCCLDTTNRNIATRTHWLQTSLSSRELPILAVEVGFDPGPTFLRVYWEDLGPWESALSGGTARKIAHVLPESEADLAVRSVPVPYPVRFPQNQFLEAEAAGQLGQCSYPDPREPRESTKDEFGAWDRASCPRIRKRGQYKLPLGRHPTRPKRREISPSIAIIGRRNVVNRVLKRINRVTHPAQINSG